MRLLILEGSGNLWGSERALLDLIDSLKGSSLELAVCCPPARPLQPELEVRGLAVYPSFVYALHEKSKVQRLLAAWGLFHACRSFQPDLIYLNQAGAARIAGLVSRILGIPVVAHVRIFEDAAYLAGLRPSPKWLRGVIAISGAIETELKSHRALEHIPVRTLYDAYQMTSGNQTPVGDGGRKGRIACAGRLTPIKGQEVLVEAIGALRDQGSVIECIFVGSGDSGFEQRLRALAESCGASQSVEWIGLRNDVQELLRTVSVLVCPSHREPLGRVIFEAWDEGCVPIVFAGSGGAAEVVRASGGGIIYESQDPKALAGAIQRALELNQDECKAFVNKGREWLRSKVALNVYGEAIAETFSSAIAER